LILVSFSLLQIVTCKLKRKLISYFRCCNWLSRWKCWWHIQHWHREWKHSTRSFARLGD